MGNRFLKNVDMSPRKIDRLVRAASEAASYTSGKRVTVSYVAQATDEPPEAIKDVLFAMLLDGRLNATYRPLHRRCGKSIDDDMRDARKIEALVHNGYYDICPTCGEEVRGMEDIVVEVLFWLA